DFADLLQDAGVRSLNISLDTLQPDRFMLLTRRDRFDRVKNNIDLMLEKGFVVKVNAVIMKGLNDDELIDFVAWTKDNPVHVRFIEFMPFSGNHWNSHRVFSMHEMVDKVRQVYQVNEMPNRPHDTARLFAVPGHAGTFAIIATMTAPFCAGCNRIRLTADGKIKNCLFSKEETNLLAAFRRGQDLLPLIRASIHSKARELGGQFSANPDKVEADKIHNRSMITIGG
ncbi:MAG TPA: radical SAM protein, partial [Puia sp.]|nr:radical SAM protein [Puia sp.]